MSSPIATVFLGKGLDSGDVGMVIRNAPIAEFEGELVPAVSMTPAMARDLAVCLLEHARMAESL